MLRGGRCNGIGASIKKLFANKWLLAVTAIGILLLVFGASGGNGSKPPPSGQGVLSVGSASSTNAATTQTSTTDPALSTAITYEKFYDHELEKMIDQISGIRDALVMVTVDSTPSEKYGSNTSTSTQSSLQTGSGSQTKTTTQQSQTQMVTVQGPNGSQVPIVVQQQLPHIIGVLVVAKSNDVVQMQTEIVGAVQDALGIPSYEITVLPRG